MRYYGNPPFANTMKLKKNNLEAAAWRMASRSAPRAGQGRTPGFVFRALWAGRASRSQLLAVAVAFLTCAGLIASARAASPGNAVGAAQASLEAAIPRADADPTRPVYHFRAPAQWMNDPNGPVYHKGYYHLFYQLNPFADTWGHMHWGHARSRDLVRWQHLPIALGPSEDRGEEHVFSGCCVMTPRGQPMIFYTSIQTNRPAEAYAEQWAALGDKELLNWQKHPANPILHEGLHRGTKVYDWRDPFIFTHKGATYMVLGGNLNERKGGQAVVTIYRAENNALTQWTYLGVLFTHPNPNVVNIECPNFFKLGEKWVLIVSPHGPVEYFVGDFNPATAKFIPQGTGTLDNGGNLYAPNSLQDSHGRRVLWGWIKGFEPGRGWNGTLTLPRVLSLGPGNQLEQRPAHELRKLRSEHFRMRDFAVNGRANPVPGLTGDCLELYVEFELLHSAAVQLQVRRSQDGARFVPITFDGGQLIVAGTKAPLELLPGERTLKLRVFLDKSVMELFVNDRACYTRVIQPRSEDIGVALAASAGTARVRSFHAWKMRSIW